MNLSNYSIQFEELKILGRGLKLCPIPPLYDHGMAKESIDKFFRNANLFLFFSDENNSHEKIELNSIDGFEHEKLKLPFKFNSPKPNMLEHIQKIPTDRILNHNPNRSRPRKMTNSQYKIFGIQDYLPSKNGYANSIQKFWN